MEKGITVGVPFCRLDNLPIERSNTYQTLRDEYGETAARKWIYWEEVTLQPAGDDNGSHKETAVVGGAVDNRVDPHQPSGNRHRRQAQR